MFDNIINTEVNVVDKVDDKIYKSIWDNMCKFYLLYQINSSFDNHITMSLIFNFDVTLKNI